MTFGLIQTANSTESYRAGKSLPVSQILPTHVAPSLPFSLSLYPSTFLLLSLVPISSILSGTGARARVGECPLFPSGSEEKSHESFYPCCIETGQTTAQSQNEHEKRRQQSKAMDGQDGALVKGMLEGLEGHYKRAACQPLYLVARHHLSKIALLVLGGRKNYDFVPMSEYTHLHKSSILFGG